MGTTAEVVALLRAALVSMERVVVDATADAELASMVGAVGDMAARVRMLLIEVERLDVPEGSCSMGWGVCPEHGRTLETGRGRSWCTVCGASWDYDREDQHCREPAVFWLNVAPVCRAHAEAAPDRSRLVPIE